MLDDVLKIATLPKMAASTAQNGFQAVASSWAPFWAGKIHKQIEIIFVDYLHSERGLQRAGWAGLGRGLLDVLLKIATLPQPLALSKNSILAVAPSWAPFWTGKMHKQIEIIFVDYLAQQAQSAGGRMGWIGMGLDVLLKIATSAEHCQKQYLGYCTSLTTVFGGEKAQMNTHELICAMSTVSGRREGDWERKAQKLMVGRK